MVPDLPTVFPLKAPQRNALELMIATSQSSTGNANMTELKTECGFKGSIPALLTGMKLLTERQSSLVKATKKATNHAQMRELVNQALGLDDRQGSAYVNSLIKQLFNIMTNGSSHYYPSAFYKAAEYSNNVKTTDGILHKMGYSPLRPSLTKALDIALNGTYVEEDKKVIIISPPKEGDDLLPRDKVFFAAVSLLTPTIDVTSNVDVAKMLNARNRPLSSNSIDFFKSNRNLVQEMDKVYAFRSSLSKKGSKTRPVHYHNAKGRWARNVNKTIPTFLMNSGEEYDGYSAIPLHIRNQFEKLFRRVRSTHKRKADADASPADDYAGQPTGHSDMEEDLDESQDVQPNKRSKVDDSSSTGDQLEQQ